MSCDILNIEWASKGRDVDIVEPILSYLELKHKLNVVRENISNAELKLLKIRPKALIISNAVGAKENFNLIKLASKLGIKIITLISEGDYFEKPLSVEESFWGWNKDRIFYEDLHLEWTSRNVGLIHKYIPDSTAFNIKVSGGTGFDRFNMLSFMEKNEFLNKYNKKEYDKVIGIAGYAFDLYFGKLYEEKAAYIEKYNTPEEIKIEKESKDALRQIYGDLISKNPDILFILKYHPAAGEMEHTEFYGLDVYKNTVSIKKEENISDVISASDIWIAYSSTTCLEAWFLNKQTLFLHPIMTLKTRSKIYTGNPVLRTAEETQNAINEFYKNGELPGFKDLESARKQIVKDIVEWDDGKNHIRAAQYIYETMNKDNKKSACIDLFVLVRILRALSLRLIYRSGLRVYKRLGNVAKYFDYLNSIFNNTERENEHKKYFNSLVEFYKTNNISL